MCNRNGLRDTRPANFVYICPEKCDKGQSLWGNNCINIFEAGTSPLIRILKFSAEDEGIVCLPNDQQLDSYEFRKGKQIPYLVQGRQKFILLSYKGNNILSIYLRQPFYDRLTISYRYFGAVITNKYFWFALCVCR